jgi:RHS repeat-associated protein
VIDSQNRRIGKKVNGTLVQGFLYQSQLAPVAELNGSNQVVSRFVYATRPNVPDYMVKASVTYRIIADHLGSVRLVVNAETGAIAQRIDYDEFGRVTQNTAPGFQPFGFAGGILDSHTGLTRLGARDYEATTGRWVAKDPLGFGGGYSNLYEYVDNDPINAIDPTGLQGFGVVVGGSVGVSAPTPYSPYGVTGTGSAGVGIFVGSGVGAFIEGGAYAGGPSGGYGAPGGVTSGDGYFVRAITRERAGNSSLPMLRMPMRCVVTLKLGSIIHPSSHLNTVSQRVRGSLH